MNLPLADLRHFARMGRRLLLPDGPELLCVFVNSTCDASCAHCFDFARRGPEVRALDMSLDELERLARHTPPLYYLLLTGGEPYLRPDLDRVALAFARHARPRILATPTNGGRPDAILGTVQRVLDGLPGGTLLSVNVSLDGVGALHDRIRGTPGLFERASETARRLLALSRRDPRLLVGAITVVSALNQDHLEEVMDYVLGELGLPSWAPFLVRGEVRDPAARRVDIERYAAISRRLERAIREGRYREAGGFLGARLANAKNVVRRGLIERTAREGRRPVPCLAGTHALVVWADGRVGSCELRPPRMGNLRDFDMDLRALLRSEAARREQRAVREADCACTHENVLSVSIVFSWRQWPSLLRWALRFRRREAQAETDAPSPAPARRGEDAVELSCFVPTRDEAAIVGRSLVSLDRALSRVARGHEIVVVDDGSRDGTPERVEAMGLPRVRVLRGGPGPSYRAELARHLLDGRGRLLCFVDADIVVDEEDIARLLKAVREGADVAIGSRYLSGSETPRSRGRLLLSLAYNAGLRRLFGSSVRDHQCGLKLFRREVLDRVLAEMSRVEGNRGWFWDAEVLIRAQRLGYRVVELPSRWREDLRASRAQLARQYRILPWLLRLYLEGP